MRIARSARQTFAILSALVLAIWLGGASAARAGIVVARSGVVKPGDTVTVPVEITGDVSGVFGFQTDVQLTPSGGAPAATVQGITKGAAVTTSAALDFNPAPPTAARIRIGLPTVIPAPGVARPAFGGPGTLAALQITVPSSAVVGQSYTVGLTKVILAGPGNQALPVTVYPGTLTVGAVTALVDTVAAPANVTFNEGQTVTVTFTVTGGGTPIPGVPVVFSVGDSTIASLGALTGLTAANGTASVQVTGLRGGTTSVTATVPVVGQGATQGTVNGVTPYISSTPPVVVVRGDTYTYAVKATDPQNLILTYSLTKFPAGMTIDPNSGVITWTPSAAQPGTGNDVTVAVTNTLPKTATQSFTVRIAKPAFVAVVDDGGRLYYAKSNGDGTFSNYAQIGSIPSGYSSRGVAVADFNNDGSLDILVGGGTSARVDFYLFVNDGHDNFFNRGLLASQVVSGNSGWAESIAAGDLNNDGNMDFVAGSDWTDVVVALGDGTGGFTTSVVSLGASSMHSRGSALIDFNHDGNLDLVRATYSDGIVNVYLGNGDGTFGAAKPVASVGSDPYGVAGADFDNDGLVDVVVNNSNSGITTFFKGKGDGTFAAGVADPSLNPQNYGAYAAYDFNEDGNMDVVGTDYSGGNFWYWPGKGDGTFGPRVKINPSTTAGAILAISAPSFHVRGTPYAVVSPAQLTVALGAVANLDGSGSNDSDTSGGSIVSYAWSFGDGVTATGPTASHVYAAAGVYSVTLKVTDNSGKVSATAAKVTVQGPAPGAVSGGPYTFGEVFAYGGIYTATLDGAQSSPQVGIARYRWDFGTLFSDSFAGSTLDATKWSASVGVTQSNAATLPGTGTWGSQYLTSQQIFPRQAQLTLTARVLPVNTSGDQQGMFGFKNTGVGNSYTDLTHAVFFYNGSIYVYEDGSQRGQFATYTRGQAYEIRIVLKGAGATYSLRPAGGSLWNVIYDSGYSGSVSLKVGATVATGTFTVDDVNVSLALEGTQPGTPVTLSDSFAGTTLNGSRWTASAGATQNNGVSIAGVSSWGAQYLFSKQALPRASQFTFQARVLPDTNTSQNAMFGFKNTNTNYSYTEMPYAIYFTGGSVQIYEDGNYRGQFASYTPGKPYDIKIVLRAPAGATYYYRAANSPNWTGLYDSNYSSQSPLLVGESVYSGTFTLGSVNTALLFQPLLSRGTYPLTLTVTDTTGQQASDSTVVNAVANNPPVAVINGPAALSKNDAIDGGWPVPFDGSQSTDDFGIYKYEWNFGDSAAGHVDSTAATPLHTYAAAGTYTVTLTVTDNALQTNTTTKTLTISAGSAPTVNLGGPYAVDGSAANGGLWTVPFNAAASVDDGGILRYDWNFGDGQTAVTYYGGDPAGALGQPYATSFFDAGTELYGYAVPNSGLLVLSTQDATSIRIIDLTTKAVLSTNKLNRYQYWWNASPAAGTYYKVESDKPVLAYESNLGTYHAAFVPSLDAGPVGHEFVLYSRTDQGFYVFAVEATTVTFYDTNGNQTAQQAMAAGTYWAPSISNGTVYRATSTGKAAIQIAGGSAFTTVPSSTGDGVGRVFYGATYVYTTGAFVVFGYQNATVNVYDLDAPSGSAPLYTQTLAVGGNWFQTGVGTKRLRFESTGDVEVWVGDTEGGTTLPYLGDDVSFAGGRKGQEFYLNTLNGGAVVFAPYAATAVTVDGTTQTLNADSYLQLPANQFSHITSTKPVVIEILGQANGFNDMGTYLGGRSTMQHWYAAVDGSGNPLIPYGSPKTYTLTLTVTNRAGQSATGTTTVTLTSGKSPVAVIDPVAPLTEKDVAAGVWTANLSGAHSTDDFGIYKYEWDFDASDGIQVNATGPNVKATYTKTGTYTVTLKVTNNNLQTSQTTTTVTVQAGQPPVARAGGPYLFGEAAASHGVWTATLDGTKSTDDAGIYDYTWTFDPAFADAFPGNVLNTTKWVASSSAVVQNGQATVTGNGGWGSQYLFSSPTFAREKDLAFQARITTAVSGYAMWGFKNDNTTYQYGQMPHAIYFYFGNLYIYEDNNQRGNFGTYTQGKTYDVRIRLKNMGAVYEYKEASSGIWVTLYESTYSYQSPLRVGGDFGSGAWQVSNVALQSVKLGPTVTRTYPAPKEDHVTLVVRDQALQAGSDTTTVSIRAGAPPVARAGGPYVVEVGSEALFNGSGSTDDVAIQEYDWEFGDSSGGPGSANVPYTGRGAAVKHFYRAVGTYNLSLTVTDNAGQTSTDTTTVNVVKGNPPVASFQVVGQGAGNGPPVYFDATSSFDDYGIVEYRWDFDATVDSDGTGDSTNNIDAVGARVFHTYLTPTGTFLTETFDSLDPTQWFSAHATAQSGAAAVVGQGWGSSYLFSTQTFGRGVRITGQVLTPANASNTMWGAKNANANYSYTEMPHAIYFAGTALYIYEEGSNRGYVGTCAANTLYDVRIDVKAVGADYFIKKATDQNWTQLTTYTSLNHGVAPLRMGATVNDSTWQFDNFKAVGPDNYLVTLTVEDGAGQTNKTTLPVTVAANLPPNVITVPWVATDPIAPHETHNGRQIHLKGIVRDADPVSFQWDFGDGTQSAVAPVTNPFDLSVLHSYPDAPAGTPFVATLKVWDSKGQLGQATYNVVVKAKTLTTEINTAIDEGLWYLHQDQTRSTIGIYDSGYWTSNARASATASSIQAFEVNGHLESSDPQVDPYQETVTRGFKQLFMDLDVVNIGTQPYGEPDTNGNGIGIETGANGSGGYPTYQGGQVMDAIASSGNRLARTLTGAANVKRRSYFDVLTDMADMFVWGQTDDPTYGGAWRYGWNADIDNSAAQWGAIGLLAAEDTFGVGVPQWAKDRNLVWLNYAFSGTGFGYGAGGTTQAGTPSGLVQLMFDDQTTSHPFWKASEAWIASNWTTQYIIQQGDRPYYPYYALTKAMRLARPEPVVTFDSNGFDWFNDPTIGLARTLIDDQLANGQFPGSTYIQGDLRSAWGVIILSRSLFVQPPVAVAGPSRVWAVDQPLTFDGSGSYQPDPFRSIVKYEWDFNGDGVFDSLSSSPLATHTYSSADYPTLPVTVKVTLRVTDNNVPPLTATDSLNVIIAVPPHPPVAVIKTPLVCTAGVPCQLDGSGSYDIDPTDYITSYQWELAGVFPYQFADATGPKPTWVFPNPGTYNVGLRVWDNGVLSPNNAKLSDQVFVKATVVANRPPVAVPGGPYAANVGATITLDGSGSSDPNGDKLTYAWVVSGGGTCDNLTAVKPKCSWPQLGSYTASLTVSDGALTNTASTGVTVQNVAPTVNAGGNQTIAEGNTAALNGSFTDPGVNETHTATIDWGDGTAVVPGVVIEVNGSGTVTGSHLYPDNGNFTVTLTVTDNYGAKGSGTFVVTVTNVNPVVTAGLSQTINEGGSVSLAPATFTDPGVKDTHTATIDWGDGTPVAQGTVTEVNGSGSVAGSHLYPQDGVYTVTVTVTDKDGGKGSGTLTVTVQNVAPVVSAGTNQVAQTGQLVSLAPATFTDVGVKDTHTATIDWGDGTGVVAGIVTEANGSGTVAGSHTYTAANLYTVTVTVKDEKNAAGQGSFTVTVTSGTLPPVANAGGPYNGNEGAGIKLDGSASQNAVTYAWDMRATGGTCDNLTLVKPTCTWPQNGVYTVALTVSAGQLSNTATATVTVVNVAPTVTAGANRTIPEGGSVALSGTFTDPGVQDTHTATINWGDGTSVAQGVVTEANGSGTVTGSHIYPDNGTFTVTLTVTDNGGGTGTGTFVVTVTNVNPVVTAGPNQTIPEGGSVSLAPATFTDAGVKDTHTATINWGDGTTTAGTVTEANGSGTVAGTHLYPQNGTYTVTVTVTDKDGGQGSGTLTVTVNNAVPVVTAGANRTISEGGSVALNGSFTDPGVQDTHTATINWGDGTSVAQGVVTEANGSGTVTGSHIYPDNGTFTVTLTVTDNGGGTGTGGFVVTVTNVNPVVTAGPNQTITEGGSVSLAPATFTDAGVKDTHTATISWGDGTVVAGTVTELNGSGTVAGTHLYPQNGNYTVTVTVTDKDGGQGSGTLTVTVNNAAPVVNAGPNQSVTLGNPLAVNATFTDAGVLDTHTATIDWGDGSSGAGTVSETGGNGTVTGSHTYAAAGTYTARVTVTDNAGGSGSGTFVATVTSPTGRVCDVNRDGKINIDDINAINAHRGSSLAADKALYDIDKNGIIDLNDSRKCTLVCDKPNCAK